MPRRKALLTKQQRERIARLVEAAPLEDRYSLERALEVEAIRESVECRLDDFLAGLQIAVGCRSNQEQRPSLWDAVEAPHLQRLRELREEHCTPENRRVLHTILRALLEVPHYYAATAITHHLRGTGGAKAKARNRKFYGFGCLDSTNGWSHEELFAVVDALCAPDRYETCYANVLMTYESVADKVAKIDPDFEDTDWATAEFVARNAKRNFALIEKAAARLEELGLSAELRPSERAETKRAVHVFQEGDVVTAKNAVDLPKNALVERHGREHDGVKDWKPCTIRFVILSVSDRGDVRILRVASDGAAYKLASYLPTLKKRCIVNGVYKGVFDGDCKLKEVNPEFGDLSIPD